MIDQKTLKTFGFIWALILMFFAYFNRQYAFILCFASSLFVVSAIFFPEIYVKTKIFQTWIKFGNICGQINSKIIILFLFFIIFTPIAFILKILKKDLLQKKLDTNCTTYFKARDQLPTDMRKQF